MQAELSHIAFRDLSHIAIVQHMASFNRIQDLRKRAGLTQGALAARTGFTQSSISMWEKGTRAPGIDDLQIIAEALGCQSSELLADAVQSRTVPILGYVGAGAVVYPIDDHPKGFGFDEIECPNNMNPDKTIAIVVRGDSMMPMIAEGDVLFYEDRLAGVPAEYIGKICAVWLPDGKYLVKRIRKGSKAGHYHLLSINPEEESLHDQPVQWSAFIKTFVQR